MNFRKYKINNVNEGRTKKSLKSVPFAGAQGKNTIKLFETVYRQIN